jgi:hypothetical protein
VQLSVSATALPSNPFANLGVSVSLPAGVTLTGTDNPTWSCTAQGACTISSIARGTTSTTVLTLGIALTAVLPISFAPAVTNPTNAIVQSQPILITPVASVPGL